MIRKSIFTAIALLLGYQLLLPHLPRKFYQTSGQQRDNYLRAQRYVYDAPDNINVVLGSSRSLDLNEETLGPGFTKLTFPGSSIFTALEIIRRAGKHPHIMLIETNNVEWDADPDLLNDVFNPWLFRIRRYLSSFREQGRPSNFVVGITEACVRKTCKKVIFRGRDKPQMPVAQLKSEQASLLKQLIAIEATNVQRVPSAALLRDHANRLGEYVDQLLKQGSICVFYEMPCDSALIDSPQFSAQRRAVEARFPRGKYDWLAFTRDHNYETVDGIHLTEPEIDRLTQTVVDQLNAIIHDEGRRNLSAATLAKTTRPGP